MKFKKSFASLLVVLCGWFSQALAQPQETRVALVIGNGSYKSSPLKNPVNDASDMALKLRGLGFTVIERNNLVVKQIGSTLREFRSKLTPGSVALVYYAGHGLQIKGDNYFPTVDADITSEEDVPNQSLAMKQIMDLLGDAKTRLNLVFLDACRDNPYSRSFRSASKGLSKENAPSGTLISFATRPGSVAADGVGRNGLYTGALLDAMNNKGQPIEQVLKRVVTSVKAESKNQQEPWMEGSIEGDFCFGNCAITSQASVSDERALWEAVKESKNTNELKAYLDRYPQGVFAGLARAKRVAIEADEKSQQPINIAGVWRGQFRGTEVVFSIVQEGASVSITRIAPPAIGQRYAGAINGNTADVITYMKDVAIATSRVSVLGDGSIRMVVMDCFNVPGHSCAPRGSSLDLIR